MRVFQNSEDREFSDYLLQCGDGLLEIQGRDGSFKVIFPSDFRLPATGENILIADSDS